MLEHGLFVVELSEDLPDEEAMILSEFENTANNQNQINSEVQSSLLLISVQ